MYWPVGIIPSLRGLRNELTPHKPYSMLLVLWLHSHCPALRWPCPKAGSWDSVWEPERWPPFVSGHRSCGLLLLQQGFQIARNHEGEELMAPDSDPVPLLTFSSRVNFYGFNFYWKKYPFQNELTKQYLHVRELMRWTVCMLLFSSCSNKNFQPK